MSGFQDEIVELDGLHDSSVYFRVVDIYVYLDKRIPSHQGSQSNAIDLSLHHLVDNLLN